MFDPGLFARVAGVGRPLRRMKGVCRAWFISKERNQTPMNKIVHYIGLDVHKESTFGRSNDESNVVENARFIFLLLMRRRHF